MRGRRQRPPWWVRAGAGAVVYAVLAYLSQRVQATAWLRICEAGGLLALLAVAGGLLAAVGARLGATPWRRGLACLVPGGLALGIPLSQVPPGGFRGRPEFVAWTVAIAGLYLVLRGISLVAAGWSQQPAALARRQRASAAAAREAEAVSRETASRGTLGRRHDLTVITAGHRAVLVASMAVATLAGLGALGLAVISGLASSPQDPQPMTPVVVIALSGAIIMTAAGYGAVRFASMRCWLDGSTLVLAAPRRRPADLAAIGRARLVSRSRGSVSVPVLQFGPPARLHRLALVQRGTTRLLPPADLVLLAAALAANPRAAEVQDAVQGLRRLAGLAPGRPA